jgi:DNA-binding MarR family transcriptional regulator
MTGISVAALTTQQQQVWETCSLLSALLPAAVNRRLQAEVGMSLADVDVLAALAESETGRLRVNDLAASLRWERSRLSHHAARMQARGLVAREECPDDGRGAFLALTPSGRAGVAKGVPVRNEAVRRLAFDALSDRDLDVLAKISDKVMAAMDTPAH